MFTYDIRNFEIRIVKKYNYRRKQDINEKLNNRPHNCIIFAQSSQ